MCGLDDKLEIVMVRVDGQVTQTNVIVLGCPALGALCRHDANRSYANIGKGMRRCYSRTDVLCFNIEGVKYTSNGYLANNKKGT